MSFLVKKDNKWLPVKNIHIHKNNHWTVIKQAYVKQNDKWISIWQNIRIFINNTNQTSINLFEYMGSPNKAGNYLFINNAEINANYGEPALRTGIFPKKSQLSIINNSYVRGYGGNGGKSQSDGEPGGDAILIEYPCSVDNSNGFLYSGGGGGGGFYAAINSNHFYRAGGGGGAGSCYGNAGESYSGVGGGAYFGANPLHGSIMAGGQGGYGGVSSGNIYTRYDGGAGGALGINGDKSMVKGTSKDTEQLFIGGAAGLAINKNNFEVKLININKDNIKGEIR